MAKKQTEAEEEVKASELPVENTEEETAGGKTGEKVVSKPLTVKGKSSKKPELSQVMYIGPGIKGVIQKNTIYRNGMPDEVSAQVAKKAGVSPATAKEFFVPVEQLAKAKADLENASSKLGILYREMVSGLEKNS